MMLTKQQAIAIFGKTATELGSVLGLTRSAISLWPDELNQRQTDLVIGAAVRLGKPIPRGLSAPATPEVTA